MLWHSMQAALPTNSFAPRIAESSIASPPAMNASNAELWTITWYWYASSAFDQFTRTRVMAV